MSKSLGNFFTVRDLLDQGYPGEVIRFVFLSTHYSKPMDWNLLKSLRSQKHSDKMARIIEKIILKLSLLPEEAMCKFYLTT